jgi:TRAP-type C4-dicarboxylate transport system permease small subunit
LRRFLERLYRGCAALGALSLVAVFAIMIAETALRKMGSYITGANDLIGWFCAASGFLALPWTFKTGELVRVGLFIDKVGGLRRRALELACLGGAAVFAGFAAWATGRYMWKGAKAGELTQGMIELPLWVPQLSLLIGLAVLCIAIVEEFVRVARGGETTYEVEARARLARGEFGDTL